MLTCMASSRDSRAPLVPGTVSPLRPVPAHIKRPEYVGKPGPSRFTGSDVKTPDAIEKIRIATKLGAQALQEVGRAIRPGISTDELDRIGHEFLLDHNAYPSTLGYRGFPKSLCTSVNEVICHGIPDSTVLVEGDIINIDVTAYIEDMHGDNNATFPVGEISPEDAQLIDHTRQALERGIKAAVPGREVNVIGRVIEKFASRFGYGVVRDYTGHGVGEAFHTGLIIPHYDSAPLYDTVIEPGMVFTIEPMLTLGTHEWRLWEDGWTVVTRDGSRTAQFEHTILITESGAEVLTLP